MKRKIYRKPFIHNAHDSLDMTKFEVEYYDALDPTRFSLYGSDVAYKTGKYYRFSDEEIATLDGISQNVPSLARHTAGMSIRFKTDSRAIRLHYALRDKYTMDNLGIIAQCGFDIYYFDEEKGKYVFHNSIRININNYDYQNIVYDIGNKREKKLRRYLIHFPLYEGINSLEIGIEKDCVLTADPMKNKQRILCYGTSIMQGGCVSRPGMCLTNFLSRHYDQEFLNYGFSGSGLLEKEVGKIVASRENIEMVIIDADANAGCETWMQENLEDFMEEIYKVHPHVPVILMSKTEMSIDYDFDRNPIINRFNIAFMKKVAKKYRSLGKEIYFISNYDVFKELGPDCTVDGIHPNDLGTYFLTQNYIKVIDKVKKDHA